MTPLKRLSVTGPDSVAFLQRLTTNEVDRPPGTVTYSLILDAGAGIRSDITVARLGEHEFQLGVNGNLDLDWLLRSAGDDGLDFGYFRAARSGLRLWDTLWAAGRPHGLVAVGRSAFNSLRLEKGYRAWGVDMTPEHDPYSAGLGFAVKRAKGEFVGRAALPDGSAGTHRLTCLTVDDGRSVVMGREPVYVDGSPAGYVTSAAYGYTVGASIAYAWLPAAAAEPGTTVHIGYFDRMLAATVATEPLFDPQGKRMRQ